ncbi:MAG: hypothetical protein ACXW08_12080 [Solirubrobacteraceae bacterium]
MPDMVQITGRVADTTSGLTVPGVQVEVWDDEGPSHQIAASATTDAGGGFTLQFDRLLESPMLGLPIIDIERPGGDQPDLPGPMRPVPAPVERPVYLKVLRDGAVLPASGDARWDGRPEVALMVDAGAPAAPPPPLGGPRSTGSAPELTITELGEALAVTAASIQQELAHYPTEKGTFVLDDLDVELPVGFGVDSLGQLRVRMASEEQQESAGRLRLRVKPLLEAPGARSATAPQPLESLGALRPEVIERLQAERVYSVGDLLRVSRNVAGARALEALGVENLASVRGRAEVVALPSVPPVVAESLVLAGIHEPKAFVAADPAELAGRLQAQLGQPMSAKDVAGWQASTRPFVLLHRPSEEDAPA